MWKSDLLDVGGDLVAGEGETPGAGAAGGGAVGGVDQLPRKATVHVTHLQPTPPSQL